MERVLNHLEGDLKLGPCVPVFRRLATFNPLGRSISGAVTPGTTSLELDAPAEQSRRGRFGARPENRQRPPERDSWTVDAADRSACCSADRDGTGDRPRRQPPRLHARAEDWRAARPSVYEIVYGGIPPGGELSSNCVEIPSVHHLSLGSSHAPSGTASFWSSSSNLTSVNGRRLPPGAPIKSRIARPQPPGRFSCSSQVRPRPWTRPADGLHSLSAGRVNARDGSTIPGVYSASARRTGNLGEGRRHGPRCPVRTPRTHVGRQPRIRARASSGHDENGLDIRGPEGVWLSLGPRRGSTLGKAEHEAASANA
jgi:hypothetical protein